MKLAALQKRYTRATCVAKNVYMCHMCLKYCCFKGLCTPLRDLLCEKYSLPPWEARAYNTSMIIVSRHDYYGKYLSSNLSISKAIWGFLVPDTYSVPNPGVLLREGEKFFACNHPFWIRINEIQACKKNESNFIALILTCKQEFTLWSSSHLALQCILGWSDHQRKALKCRSSSQKTG